MPVRHNNPAFRTWTGSAVTLELPLDITLEEAAKAESKAKGKAKGRAEGKAEVLADIVAHMFPEQADAFLRFLDSCSPEAWPDVSVLLSWTGMGGELMEWLADGQPESP